MLVRRNCRRASELENQKFAWPNVSLAGRPIAEDLWTSPSRFDRDILHAIHRKGYRRRRDSNSGVEFPERFPVRGAVGGKFSVGAALKHEISPGGQRPSTLRIGQVHMPRFFLCDRVPCEKPAGAFHFEICVTGRSAV